MKKRKFEKRTRELDNRFNFNCINKISSNEIEQNSRPSRHNRLKISLTLITNMNKSERVNSRILNQYLKIEIVAIKVTTINLN